MFFSHNDGSFPEVEGPPGSEMNNIVFIGNGIIKLLNTLNHQKASGSDGISARILKVCSEEVADALDILCIHQPRKDTGQLETCNHYPSV